MSAPATAAVPAAVPAAIQAYLDVCHRLQARGVAFVLTGSFALGLYMASRPDAFADVPDCDVFLAPAPDNVRRWGQVLHEEGWRLSVWDEPLSVPWDAERLRGKYYVRARQGPRVLDGTYEHDTLELGAVVARAGWRAGLPVMELELLLALKRQRGTPRDWAQVARVEDWRRAAGTVGSGVPPSRQE